MAYRLVYVTAPYSGDRANLARARRWLHWCWRTYPGHGFLAPWIDACEALPETPENRAAGLRFDAEVIALADEVWLVGDRVSVGMAHERDAAIKAGIAVRDMTAIGPEPPDDLNAAVA